MTWLICRTHQILFYLGANNHRPCSALYPSPPPSWSDPHPPSDTHTNTNTHTDHDGIAQVCQYNSAVETICTTVKHKIQSYKQITSSILLHTPHIVGIPVWTLSTPLALCGNQKKAINQSKVHWAVLVSPYYINLTVQWHRDKERFLQDWLYFGYHIVIEQRKTGCWGSQRLHLQLPHNAEVCLQQTIEGWLLREMRPAREQFNKSLHFSQILCIQLKR